MRALVRFLGFAALMSIAGAVYIRGIDESESHEAASPGSDIPDTAAPPALVGRVWAGSRAVAGARVRLKGHAPFALTDSDGRFELHDRPQAGDTVTAAKEGYLIAGLAASAQPLEIHLFPLATSDCERYEWLDPTPNPSSVGACGNCHQAIYEEWRASGHARSAVNRRFQNLLDGSDWQGRAGHGWGLATEYPEGIGVCWSCHAPSLNANAESFDLRQVEGVAAAGVHCDFCHKIRDTSVEQAGLTHGFFAYELMRPAEGQLFFGPLDDVDRGEDAYSHLQSESRICAACHEGTVFGVPVYTTWSEWLASPAAREGRQCQNCHMTPSGTLTNVAPGSGGIERDPASLGTHSFLPAGREAMLRRAVDVSFAGRRKEEAVDVSITLVLHDVGHRLPTGFIDRHLLLIVEPVDHAGEPATVSSGLRLPAAAGNDLAGKPGQLFAKLLTDADGRAPAPFWRAGVSITDSRLQPDRPESFTFRFSPATERVRVRIVYRRFWQEVADSKQWPEDEIVVCDRWFVLP
ncbi:MAG TPA: multiheme c-type cytochrome [Pirellulales bacterium]|nr:multiheme c-type cytochrome [Pirellulales bacterium]